MGALSTATIILGGHTDLRAVFPPRASEQDFTSAVLVIDDGVYIFARSSAKFRELAARAIEIADRMDGVTPAPETRDAVADDIELIEP